MSKKKGGMTLIELIVAVTVFASAAVPLLGVFSYGLRMERRALVQTLATYTAQMKIEEAYGMSAVELIEVYGNSTGTIEAGGTTELYYKYSAELYEPDTDDDDGEYSLDYGSLGLYKVTVTVGSEYYGVEAVLEDIFYAVRQ